MGDDLLPGTDRMTDGRTVIHVNLKVTYRHFENALAIGKYGGSQGIWSYGFLHCSIKLQCQTA
jgi:hypothetical protein